MQSGLSAVESLDWALLGTLLDDPIYMESVSTTPEAMDVLREAVATQGESIAIVFRQALLDVAGYDADVLIADIDFSGSRGSDISYPDGVLPTADGEELLTEELAQQFADQAAEFVRSAGYTLTESVDGFVNELPTYPSEAGTAARSYFDTAADVVGATVGTLLTSFAASRSCLIELGSSLNDIKSAIQLGKDTGREYGNIVSQIDDVWDGRLSVKDWQENAESAVTGFQGRLTEQIPTIGPTLKALFFGTRNSDVTVAFGTDQTALDGSTHNDYFILSYGDDVYHGGEGNDVLHGLLGNDSLDGEEGTDLLAGGSGNDDISGGNGNDHIEGGSGQDRAFGESGNDAVFGGDGRDTLAGGRGRDKIAGDDGADKLFGGADRDGLFGGAGDDYLSGGAVQDRLFGHEGDDSLFGNQGRDLLIGDQGSDVLIGGLDADRIRGGSGDDIIDAGAQKDRIDVGGGADTVIYERGDDRDRVYGFDSDDVVDLSDFGFKSFDALADIILARRGNTIIPTGGDNTLILIDYDASRFDADNVIL